MHDGNDISEIVKVVLVVGFAAFTAIVKAIKAKKPAETPPVLSDEARRVREEIGRKIAERRGGRPVLPPAAPPLTAQRTPASQTMAPRPVYGGKDTLQDVLRERLRRREAAEAKRLADLRQAALVEMAPPQPVIVPVQAQVMPKRSDRILGEPQPTSAPLNAAVLAADLSSSDALRRAFVMNEILGAPLSLRPSRLTAW